jgi:Retrotransposon gag protein
MPLNLNPSKPSSFDGGRNAFTVNTWIYQVEQYFAIVQVRDPETTLSDETKLTYASSLFTQTAAAWWYRLVQIGQVPGTWEAFIGVLRAEFIPQDHVRRARDKLRKLRQRTFVTAYISEFRNLVLTIP